MFTLIFGFTIWKLDMWRDEPVACSLWMLLVLATDYLIVVPKLLG